VSAMPVDRTDQHDDGDETAGLERPEAAGTPVVVRRRAGVAALVGYAASAVAIAYLWRASQTAAFLDWALCVVMTAIAVVYLASLVDARTPLLVADDLGVRIRLGDEWRGLPWEAVGQVVVHPRRGLLRDGRLVFAPRSLARALDGLDVKARRHVALNQKMYGAALAVPLGTTTRVSRAGDGTQGGSGADPATGIASDITTLARGRADVVVLDPRTLEVLDDRAPESSAQEAREAAGDAAPGTRNDTAAETKGGADVDAPAGPGASAGAEPDAHRVVFPARGAVDTDEPDEQASATAAPAAVDGPTDLAPGRGSDLPEDMSVGLGTGEDTGEQAPRRSIFGGIGTIVSRVAKGRARDLDGRAGDPATGADDETASDPPSHSPAELRQTRPGLRAEATLDLAPTDGAAALDPGHGASDRKAPLPEGRELRRPGSVDLVFERVEVDDRVRPISAPGDAVEPLVIDDYVTEPAYDPVIGPELTAARTRLGLSVDDLAERTRIRPHVIESIEVDDFAPCGGDVYARGHLRTLARVLGKDVEPLLALFEERYATAPINARRVFEAELATGMTGSMRSTVGGPSWGLLVGVVLALVLVWGLLRLFTSEPSDVHAPVVNGAAFVSGAHSATTPAGSALRWSL
jgi:hypothetical protein